MMPTLNIKFLKHSWGDAPEQKAKEKKYNHEYYMKHKRKNNLPEPPKEDPKPMAMISVRKETDIITPTKQSRLEKAIKGGTEYGKKAASKYMDTSSESGPNSAKVGHNFVNMLLGTFK
jgi:hypothetical protein